MRFYRMLAISFAVFAVTGCSQRTTSSHPATESPKVERLSGSVPAAPASQVQSPAELAPDEFFAKASESVVVVRNPDASLLGSGVEIRPGVFVTNCHVLRGGNQFFVARDRSNYPALLIRSDEDRDICLLRSNAGEAHPAMVRSAKSVRVGERVYALGNPQGFELTLSEGLVSQLRRADDSQMEPYIQTTAAISQGSSGGGLFDSKGRLIGISSFMWREGQNLNFAAPIDWAVALEDENQGAPVSDSTPAPEEPNAAALNDDAKALIEENRAADAIPLLEKAAALAPTNAEIAGNLGYAYLLNSRYSDARDRLLEDLNLAPRRAATWLNLGQAYAELGLKDEAVRSVVNGYNLSSRKQKVRDALSRVRSDESATEAWKQVADSSLATIDSDQTDQ